MSRPAKGAGKLIPKPVRLTADEHRRTEQSAQRRGMTPAEFRRQAVLAATNHDAQDAGEGRTAPQTDRGEG
mgnify:CR=1 FL=1